MAEVNFLVKKGLTVPKGSAATPAVIFDASDPNTGIYSPGADQVAISTNGTGRLFVDASGNVAIGTSSTIANTFRYSASSPTIRLSDSTGTTSNLAAQILFQELGTTSAVGRVGYVGGDAILRIKTDGAQPIVLATNDAERLRITSDGKLGLGTSSPSTRFHISESNAGGYASVLLLSNSANSAGDCTGIYGSAAPGTAFPYRAGITFWPGAAGALSFHTGNNATPGEGTRMYITDSGNVGVGTTSPGRKLSIADSTAPTLGFYRGATEDATISSELAAFAISTYNNTPIKFSIVSGSSGFSERAQIDSSGHLLVGTSSWTGSANPATGIQLAENYTIAAQQGGGISGNGVKTIGTTSASTTVSLPSGQTFTNFIGTLYVALTLFNSATSIIAEYRVKITNGGSTATFTLVDSVDDSGAYAASITPTYNSTTRVITVSTSWTGSVNSSLSASLVGAGAGGL